MISVNSAPSIQENNQILYKVDTFSEIVDIPKTNIFAHSAIKKLSHYTAMLSCNEEIKVLLTIDGRKTRKPGSLEFLLSLQEVGKKTNIKMEFVDTVMP